MLKSIWRGILGAAVVSAGVLVSACSGGGGASGSASTTTSTTPAAATVILTASTRSLKSDGSDSATITASVVDSNNLAVSGATVNFTATSGQLGTSSGVSSSTGVVTIPYSAGNDATNRTDVVTAKVVGTNISATIPIKVTGSTLTVTSSQTGNSTNDISIIALAKDVSGAAVSGQQVRFAIDTSACSGATTCGSGTLSASSATTDSNGFARVTLTPTASGVVVIKTSWYGPTGVSTYTVSSEVSTTAVGTSFAVTTPSENYYPVSLGSTQALSVAVPSAISSKAVANVRLATTLGTWSNGQKSITLVPSGNVVNDVLTAGNSAGNATMQIDALDSSGKTLASISRVFALSAPASQAGTVTLQAAVSNIAPSTGGTTNSTTLTATVRTATTGGNPANAVGNAPVLFEIVDSTGSGEELAPVLVYTNSSGQAQTTFTSGSQSTIGGVRVKATVLGVAGTIADTKTIYVNATGVSISVGMANVAQSANNDTNYIAPMSVLVVDNAGTAVKNALVTLSAFPVRYYKGYRNSECAPVYTNVGADGDPGEPNEDVNENEILDPGEDANGDGSITPQHAAAGTVPSTVTTDENGVATFSLTYQKQYASWIKTRIRAKVVIATGTTESTNELRRVLPYVISDANPCTLPNSPWGQ